MTKPELTKVVTDVLGEQIELAKPDDLAFLEMQVPFIAGEIYHRAIENKQAGSDIEITPEMIDAGVDAFYAIYGDDCRGEWLVRTTVAAIYKSMISKA